MTTMIKAVPIGVPSSPVPVRLITVIEAGGVVAGIAGIVLMLLASATVGAVLIALCCLLGLIGSLLLRRTRGLGKIAW